MTNVLKMDLYRMRKGKLLYLLLGISALVNILYLIIFGMSGWLLDYLNNNIANAADSDIIFLMQAVIPSTYSDYMQQLVFQSNIPTLYIMIFMVLFWGAEYGQGFIKNTINKTRNKGYLVFSRLIVTAIVTVMVYLLSSIVMSVGCMVNGTFRAEEISQLLGAFFIGILLNIAVTTFFTMLFTIWQNMIPTLISGICYLLMGSNILTWLSMPIQAMCHQQDFDFNKFTCMGNLVMYNSIGAEAEDYVRSVIVSVVILGISVFVSIYNMKRKDV